MVNTSLFAKKTRIFQRWQNRFRKMAKVEDLINKLSQAGKNVRSTYVVTDAGLTEIPKGTITVFVDYA